MTSVARLLAWAERRLDLRSNSNYNRGDGYVALADVALDLHVDTYLQSLSASITTTAGTATYPLPSNCTHILRVEWPAEWSAIPIRAVSIDLLDEIARQIAAGEDAYSSSQPTHYAILTESGGRRSLRLERAGAVGADLDFVVHYYPAEYKEESTVIDLRPEEELAAKYGVAWQLAEIYAPDKVQYYFQQYTLYKAKIVKRQTWASSETPMRPVFDF